jgi:hypothetical protein
MPCIGASASFMRVAAVYDDGGALKAVVKKFLICLDDQHRWNLTVRVSQHAVVRDDGEAFDCGRTGHRVEDDP